MLRVSRLSLIFAVVTVMSGCSNYYTGITPPSTVSTVDPGRYAGRWYEIARFPNGFQKGCAGTYAEYALKDDGTLSVFNVCRSGGLEGPVKSIDGKAWATDSSNAKLKVRFNRWWGFFFTGDYWIIALDSEYQRAVVSGRKGDYLWILSRRPDMPADQYEKILSDLKNRGFRTDLLEKTPQ